MANKSKTKTDILSSPSDIKFARPEHAENHSMIWSTYPPGYLVSEFTDGKYRAGISFSVRSSNLIGKSEGDNRSFDILRTNNKLDAEQIRQAIFDHYQKITEEGLPQPRDSVLNTLV